MLACSGHTARYTPLRTGHDQRSSPVSMLGGTMDCRIDKNDKGRRSSASYAVAGVGPTLQNRKQCEMLR